MASASEEEAVAEVEIDDEEEDDDSFVDVSAFCVSLDGVVNCWSDG